MQNEIYSKCQKIQINIGGGYYFTFKGSIFFCSPSVLLIPNTWKYYQSKGRGVGKTEWDLVSNTRQILGCPIKSKQILPVSSRDAKSWKEHHAYPYKNNNNNTLTHSHTQPRTINSHLSFILSER